MTYWIEVEDLEVREKYFRAGALRVWHEEQQCFSVTEAHDINLGTAYVLWFDHGGEVWNGERWIRMPEYFAGR